MMPVLPAQPVLPVLVTQHSADVEPGFFGDYLNERGIPWVLLRIDLGEPLPEQMAGFSGLGLMGGEMGVNDPLPWIEPLCALIREADALGRPVIGHCLGGQLIAKAMGARVQKHVRKELGWGELQILDERLGHDWLGQGSGALPTFQWHGDTFDWPVGAQALLGGVHCAHQAYVIERKDRVAHLGMQCHMEMTSQLVQRWVSKGAAEVQQALVDDPSAVQTPQDMLNNVQARCEAMRIYTRRLYDRWVQGLYCNAV